MAWSIWLEILLRWFVDRFVNSTHWSVTTPTKNYDRLQEGDLALTFLASMLEQPQMKARFHRAFLG